MAMFGSRVPVKPFQIDGIGGPVDTRGAEMGALPGVSPAILQQDGGFLGKAAPWMGVIGDALLAANNRPAMYTPMIAQQRQQEREQQNAIERWKTQFDYERANPKPINNDTANDYAFWQSRLSPEEFAVWRQNKIDPPQYRQGPDGQFYRISPTAPPPITAEDWDKGQPFGGPASASGGFHIPSGNPLDPPRR